MHDAICKKACPYCLCNTCAHDSTTKTPPCCCSSYCGCPVYECPDYKKENKQ